jgi:hypothetical protein
MCLTCFPIRHHRIHFKACSVHSAASSHGGWNYTKGSTQSSLGANCVRKKGIRWKNSPDTQGLIHILTQMHYNLTYHIERIFCCSFPDTCTSFPVLLLHVIDLLILFLSFSFIYHLSFHVTVMFIRITFIILYVLDMFYRWLYLMLYGWCMEDMIPYMIPYMMLECYRWFYWFYFMFYLDIIILCCIFVFMLLMYINVII